MIKPATPAAAGSSTAAVIAGALLGLLAAAALCSGSSVTGDEAELITSTGSISITNTRRREVVVPAMYVFGDSLVDAGNNDFLPAPAPKAVPPNGVDLPRTILRRTGRFTNGYNLADIIAGALAPISSSDRRTSAVSGHRRRRRRRLPQSLSTASRPRGLEVEPTPPAREC